MAEKLTKQETEAFYDLCDQIDEFDPGIDAFNTFIKHANEFLDEQGTNSAAYSATIDQLNMAWEYYGQHTKLYASKIYITDVDLLCLIPEDMGQPQQDKYGWYFTVDGMDLVSTGIIDVGEPETWATEDEASYVLAYGFTLDDNELETPLFYAKPDDILHAEYDYPSMDAITSRLYREHPEVMELLMHHIDKAGVDPMKLVKKLRKTWPDLQDTLQGPLGNYDLGRYLFHHLELDREWAYGLKVTGNAWLMSDDDDQMQAMYFNKPSLFYGKFSALSIDTYDEQDDKKQELGFVFTLPTPQADPEGSDKQIIIPINSIKAMFSTRPPESIDEVIFYDQQEKLKDMFPEGFGVSLVDDEPLQHELHPRIAEYNRLSQLENVLTTFQKEIQRARRIRRSSSDDALEVARYIDERLQAELEKIGLTISDCIKVGGEGVSKAYANLITNENGLHIVPNQEIPIGIPPITDEVTGIVAGTVSTVDRYEDDDNEYWLPAVKLVLHIKSISTPLITSDIPLLEVTVDSKTLARLDNTSFEIPELDRMRRRNEALLAATVSDTSARNIKNIKNVQRALFNENPGAWNEAGSIVKGIRQLAHELQEDRDDRVVAALREEMIDRPVRLVADVFSGKTYETDADAEGIVRDIFFADTPNGSRVLTMALDNATNDMKLVVLRTLSQLSF